MRLPITRTNHLVELLKLSPTDFERFVFWIVDEEKKFDFVEHIGGTGDEARDVIGYKIIDDKKKAQWYYNCKRYKENKNSVFTLEIDEIARHSEEDVDYRPKAVIFCTAESLSAQNKKSIRKYAKSKGINHIQFLGKTELDKKYKEYIKVNEEFFGENTQSSEKIADEMILSKLEEMQKQLKCVDEKITNPIITDIREKSYLAALDEISEDLIKIKEDIDRGSYSIENESEINKYIGKLELAEEEKKDDLFRAYNLLGIIHLRRGTAENKDEIEKARDNFLKALTYEPENYKGYNNLYLCYLNLGQYDLIEDKIIDKFIKESLIVQIKTYKIQAEKGNTKAIEFLNKVFENDKEKADDIMLKALYADLLFRDKKYDECIEICESINAKEKKAENYLLLGNAYLEKALREDRIGEEQFSVIFKEKKNVLKAINAYEQGLKLDLVLPAIKSFLEVHLFQAKSIAGENEIMMPDALNEDIQEYHSAKAVQLFKERMYDEAYKEFVRAIKIEDAHESDAFQLGIKFLYEGQYEISEDIFNKANLLDKELQKRKFINLSVIGILKNDKNFALVNAENAKELVENSDDQAYSNFNGVNMRFGEVDRAVENLFYMQERNPEKEILIPKEFNEVKKIFEQQNKFLENLVSIFKEQPFPYYLITGKRFLNKSFIEFWNRNYGIIPIKYNTGSAARTVFEKEIIKKNNAVIVDYISLLTLSVFNGLDLLNRYFNKIYLSKELFYTIQHDLIQYEDKHLRNAWEFLRKNKNIFFVKMSDFSNLKQKKLFDFFEDEWIKETASFAKEKNVLLLTDDLRFGNFLSLEGINFVNTSSILQLAKEERVLDRNIYSRALGEIALRGYEFIQFDAEDVFCLEGGVVEVSNEVKKLFGQISIDNAEFKSFVRVAWYFIQKIKKWTIDDERKVEYLKFFTRMFDSRFGLFYIQKKDKGVKELGRIIYLLWRDSYDILKINKDAWNKAIEEVFSIEFLFKYKEKLKK